jgi:predicted nucleic acid-binding protein
VDELFLDANVLFSAAYRPDTPIRRLWRLPGTRLLTSLYASEEARRNLREGRQRVDLEELLASVSIVEASADPEAHPDLETVKLPDKDMPILLAAVAAGATHLVTGDLTHFGQYYGSRIAGVLVLPPAAYPQSPPI